MTALLLLGLAAGAVSASVTTLTWHRLNPGDPPEHERYFCVAGATWSCRYDKLPERRLGFAWDQTRGTFSGTDTTDDWVCPEWFTSDPCAAADTVISGVGTFYFPRASGSFSVDQQLLVSDDGLLWIYWVDQFVCVASVTLPGLPGHWCATPGDWTCGITGLAVSISTCLTSLGSSRPRMMCRPRASSAAD